MQSLLHTVIPVTKIVAVENALLNAFTTTVVNDITLLAGGLSASAVYKIVINDQPYVLKVDNAAQITAKDELTCMEIAANADIAPPVYYFNAAEGILITGFIKGLPPQAVLTSPGLLLPALAKTILAIHTMPLFTKESNMLETVDGLVNQFKSSKMLLGPVFDECYEYYEVIRKHYPWYDTDKVSSHNDLNPGNMLCDGEKIWIIDWDAAFKNDRYVDLAIAANFFVHTAEHEALFLHTYFGDNLTSYNSARFFVMRQICNLVYAIMMFKLADTSNPLGLGHNPDMQNANLREVGEQLRNGKLQLSTYEGQLIFGKALINEALRNMRLPRFTAAIELLN